ncbi:MAG: hypothetical protein KF741_11120 [Ferruginibacter sp.]|nr:hypothetical protein [Bacteroidota bacterium]MBX2919783.1 hypothetical protein [Ferruginibacter sp.]MCB0709920.1 hypothetical protein [Chitinophagaceae bacterium]MCC7378903.1 hypothetical protein [Chitinophagaceae bacterium]
MNRLLLFFLLLCTGIVSNGQAIYPYQDIKLEKPSDYIETEPFALSAANYVLTTTFDAESISRQNAVKFLADWVSGAKKYNFYMQNVAEYIRSDIDLLSLFIAAMAKYNLEHKQNPADALTVEKNACRMVLDYCNKPANKFNLKKKFRKKLEENAVPTN